MLHQVTIKDIAKRLRISVSTVSRALRDSTEINASTRKLVKEVAEEMKYSPNPVALSLKEKKTRVIGVIVQEIANNYCSSTIAGIEDWACKMGYNVLISQSHECFNTEVANMRLLASRRVDGVLLTISNETKTFDHVKEVIDKGIPVVMFDRVSDEVNTHKVVVDDYQGAYDATRHLIAQGHKKIAHFTISRHLGITQNRLNGYLDALRKENIRPNKNWIVFCDFNEIVIAQMIRKLVREKSKPTAIFCSVERLSILCLKVLKEMNIQIPEEIALAGFSDNPLGNYLNPALTTVNQPTFSIGQKATELLIDLIEDEIQPEAYKIVQLQTTLNVRASSMRVEKVV